MGALERLFHFVAHPTGARGVEPPKLEGFGQQTSEITGKKFPVSLFGFGGIKDEAAFIREMVDHGKGDLGLKEKTLKIIRDAGVPSRDEEGQASAIAKWVQENIYYVHEGIQFFQKPATTLRLLAGQCDDFTILIGSMLEGIGIPARLVLMKVNGHWKHIFPTALVNVPGHGSHRIPLDATLKRESHPVEEFPSPVAIAQGRGDKIELLEA